MFFRQLAFLTLIQLSCASRSSSGVCIDEFCETYIPGYIYIKTILTPRVSPRVSLSDTSESKFCLDQFNEFPHIVRTGNEEQMKRYMEFIKTEDPDVRVALLNHGIAAALSANYSQKVIIILTYNLQYVNKILSLSMPHIIYCGYTSLCEWIIQNFQHQVDNLEFDFLEIKKNYEAQESKSESMIEFLNQLLKKPEDSSLDTDTTSGLT